jgi:hypothetical protein
MILQIHLMLFVLGACSTAAGWPELGLSICSIGVMSLFVNWVVKRGHLIVNFLSIAFLVGYFLSWCVGFLGCRYVLPWRGLGSDLVGRHPVVTAILVLLAVSGTCLGGWTANHLVRPVRNYKLFRGFTVQQMQPQLLVLGTVFLIQQILIFKVMGLNGRWEIGNLNPVGSSAYWLGGIQPSMLSFYVLLGCSLKRSFWSPWNCWVGGIVLACAGLNILTGGRGMVLEIFVLSGIGALFSQIGWRALATLFVLGLPMFIIIIIVIGWSRSMGEFAGGTITDKISTIEKVITKGPEDNSDYGDPYYQLFSRLFEPSAQVVIDDVADNNTHLGWLNFDRLPFLFVPKFVYPSKVQVQDGWERLIKFHGYQDNDFSAAPLTLLADSYERFGITGVIGFHFAAGMLLVLVARLVLVVRWRLLGVIFLGCFTLDALGLYVASVLEFISAISYEFCRDALVITCIFVIGRSVERFLYTK